MSLKKKRILFVVEGLRREMGIFDNLGTVFFNEKSDVITLPVPADMNIYMLYAAMKKDDFETDVVELLKERIPAAKKILEPYCRDDFAEVYFFFDFDAHSNNLHEMDNVDALREMLEKLNNETEMGKLYISYPMVEALRDYVVGDCRVVNGPCLRHRKEFDSYKHDSAANPDNNAIKDYAFLRWKEVLLCYAHRVSCLFQTSELDYRSFVDGVTPSSIFEQQMRIYAFSENVFILSCLPEFLIDYSAKYWNAAVGKRKKPIRHKECPKPRVG